jgi:uncharacterized protein YbjT (DUF2867 family)
LQILVTGGTGHLGRSVVERLQEAHHDVRVLSRQPGADSAVEWIKGDLGTGAGIEEAVSGTQVVIHAATNSPAARRGGFRPLDFVRSPTDVDVKGTKLLLEASAAASVDHFLHISIVGLPDLARVPYSRVKLRAEQLVRESSVPWSIARATGFYWLLDRMLAKMTSRRRLRLPTEVCMEPVDSDDFADFVIECVRQGPKGEREDFVGPERLTIHELAEQYLDARGLSREIRKAPLPKAICRALEAGNTGAGDARRGSTTWAEWLRSEASAVATG